jgi:hypothetical protein
MEKMLLLRTRRKGWVKSVLLFYLFTFLPLNAQLARYRHDFTLNRTDFVDSIAIEWDKEQIFLPVDIDGKRYRFLFDTGAAQAAIVELSGVIESGVAGMSEAIGTLIGDLINGENAWQGFAQAGIGVVADMLSTVGKAFVTEGVGVIAAQMALKTGNGPAAIAAGAAMIALAATMKTAMSNAAANWGGSSGSVATSSYSSGTSSGVTAFGREMNIKVSGTLTANGSKLVAVLNNENDRRNYTT